MMGTIDNQTDRIESKVDRPIASARNERYWLLYSAIAAGALCLVGVFIYAGARVKPSSDFLLIIYLGAIISLLCLILFFMASLSYWIFFIAALLLFLDFFIWFFSAMMLPLKPLAYASVVMCLFGKKMFDSFRTNRRFYKGHKS
jgi:hypothetical protein